LNKKGAKVKLLNDDEEELMEEKASPAMKTPHKKK
jgi:hypothetical protein